MLIDLMDPIAKELVSDLKHATEALEYAEPHRLELAKRRLHIAQEQLGAYIQECKIQKLEEAVEFERENNSCNNGSSVSWVDAIRLQCARIIKSSK